MLQRTPFMTPQELGIDTNAHKSLRGVLTELESGDAGPFDMTQWQNCIGGMAERINGGPFQSTQALFDLYVPPVRSGVSAEQGAQALRNYLTFGAADWVSIQG